MTPDERFQRLVKMLSDPQNSQEAIKSLGATGDPRAVEPLAAVLRDRRDTHAMDYRDRQLAAEAMGQIGDLSALPHLLNAADDVSSSVKISVARSLGQLGDLRAVDALVAMLEDSNGDVRTAAIRGVGRLSQQNHVPVKPMIGLLADPADSVRQVTTQVLRDLGVDAYEVLIEGLTHPNSTIRGAAADLLGDLGDERAREALETARYDDDSNWVRTRAEAALEKLPPVEINWPGTKRQKDTDSALSTLDLIRSQGPQNWPSLGKKTAPQKSEDEMTRAEIQQILDGLDVRLAKGEITQATYEKLVARWQKRLDE